jgi:hypothetical protein
VKRYSFSDAILQAFIKVFFNVQNAIDPTQELVNGLILLELPFFISLCFVSLPLSHPHSTPTFELIGWS